MALANLPGNIFAYYATDYLGRKVTLLVSMLASAGSIFSILKIHSTTGTTVFSCVFAGVSVAGWNSLNILSAENFATRYAVWAMGLPLLVSVLSLPPFVSLLFLFFLLRIRCFFLLLSGLFSVTCFYFRLPATIPTPFALLPAINQQTRRGVWLPLGHPAALAA